MYYVPIMCWAAVLAGYLYFQQNAEPKADDYTCISTCSRIRTMCNLRCDGKDVCEKECDTKYHQCLDSCKHP